MIKENIVEKKFITNISLYIKQKVITFRILSYYKIKNKQQIQLYLQQEIIMRVNHEKLKQ